MNLPLSYRDFLDAKMVFAAEGGFEVSLEDINPLLKPHQKVMVQWGCRGGRRAVFAAFGLGKSFVQLEILRLVLAHTGMPVLQVAPLGVRLELIGDAAVLATGDRADITDAQRAELAAWLDGRPDRVIGLTFIRHSWEVKRSSDGSGPGQPLPGHYLANYESVRDGKIDVKLFGGASLDEASCLRGLGGTKTFREFMRLFDGMAYKFVATATPSPNEYIELLAYSAFLEVMDVGQAKTRFFKRNSEKADTLTIHPHKEREFWLWVASWALFVERPSDLGFSDEGYELPGITIHWHELPANHLAAGAEKSGQGRLFKNAAASLSDAAREKRDSLAARVAKVTEIIASGREAARVSAGILSQEPRGVAGEAAGARQKELSGQPRSIPETGQGVAGEEPGARRRSGSRLQGEEPREAGRDQPAALLGQQGPPSRTELAASPEGQGPDAGPVRGAAGGAGASLRDLPSSRADAGSQTDVRGPRSPDRSGEGSPLPAVQHRDWTDAGRPATAHERSGLSDQIVLWCDLNDEQSALGRALDRLGLTTSSLFGSQDIDVREDLLERWRKRKTSVFLSKPIMYGAGINLQQCSTMIFVGIGHKFQDLIQACHRIYRFGQKRPVNIHFIYTEAERPIRDSIEEKWRRHDAQRAIMTAIIREYGLSEVAMAASLKRGMGVERREVAGDGYHLVNADCVEETTRMDDNSVDLIVTSIPFSTQYEYSPNYADFGHTDDDAHFWQQMDYLIPQLLRVLAPGRVAMIHVKDRIVPGGLTGLGFQTLSPFSDDCVARFRAHGWAFLSRITVTTDVVRENNQTYRLGWTEQCKDGSRMGNGLPEYCLVFRKPPSDNSDGYADVKVKKDKRLFEAGAWSNEGYSRGRWQIDAHGFHKSSGDRLLTPAELRGLDAKVIYRLWKRYSLGTVYNYEGHVALAEGLEEQGALPPDFMLLPPHSDHPAVWTDIARMLSMNTLQAQAGREMHLCPLQFDIIDRAIVQYSMPGEVVFDPFGGLMSVPYRAIKLKRRGRGVELNPAYFADGCAYVDAAAREAAMPSLMDLLETEGDET
jgi:hypothetical protein